MCERLNVLEWLNTYYENTKNFNDDKINAVRDFSLLWNLLESKLGNRNVNIQTLATIASTTYLIDSRKDFYISCLEYLKQRYINNNITNEFFDQLRFRATDKREFVANVFKQAETNPEKIIEALLIIIYRLRNNMFYGEKELNAIHSLKILIIRISS